MAYSLFQIDLPDQPKKAAPPKSSDDANAENKVPSESAEQPKDGESYSAETLNAVLDG